MASPLEVAVGVEFLGHRRRWPGLVWEPQKKVAEAPERVEVVLEPQEEMMSFKWRGQLN